MLAEKPWRTEAVVRLCLALFLCQFIGSVTLAAVRFYSHRPEANLWLVGALVAGSVACSGVALFLIRQPWDIERFARQALFVILFTYLGLALGLFVQHFSGQPGEEHLALRVSVGALCFQGMLLALLPIWLRSHGETLRNGFGLDQKAGSALAAGIVVGIALFFVGQRLQDLSARLISHLGSQPQTQLPVEALRNSDAWQDRAAIAVVAMLLAPLAEEVLFRGILYPAIKRGGWPRLALWGTSLLFAVVHANLPTFLPLFLFAMVLALLYERTGNLLAPVAAHLLFNTINFFRFLWAESQMPPPG